MLPAIDRPGVFTGCHACHRLAVLISDAGADRVGGARGMRGGQPHSSGERFDDSIRSVRQFLVADIARRKSGKRGSNSSSAARNRASPVQCR